MAWPAFGFPHKGFTVPITGKIAGSVAGRISGGIVPGSGLVPVPAPVLEAYASNSSTGSAVSLTITKPSGTAEGDLLVAVLGRPRTGGSYDWANPALAGWNVLFNQNDGGNPGLASQVLWKVAGGSEGASYTFNYVGSSFRSFGYVFRVSGADPTTPIPEYSNAYDATDSVTWSASITAPGSAHLGLAMGQIAIGNQAGLNPSIVDTGWTEIAVTQPDNLMAFAVATISELPESAQSFQVTRTQIVSTQLYRGVLLAVQGPT